MMTNYERIKNMSVIMCCGCGKWLDNTKAITREDAEKALREREGE